MSKFDIDKNLIRDLAHLLQETGLSEIELEEATSRLRLVRAPVMVTAPAAAAGLSPSPAALAPAAAPAQGAAQEADLASHPGAVSSPMVGTAYLAPEPSAPAFVNVGDRVRKGQTLLIIEAMKTFNEIPAPKDGTVTDIRFENGAPIEFGDILMLIE